MELTEQIIFDLKNKVGSSQSIDFLSDWKGVPVMIRAHIQEVRDKSIIFRVEPPDSVCLAQDDYALILHDIFIVGIRARILDLDLPNGTVELAEFRYKDRGFGYREMVRVEPDVPIEAVLSSGEVSFSVHVVDLSLNGFGILAQTSLGEALTLGQAITLKVSLLDQEIEISGKLLGLFPQENRIRLAMSFSSDVSGSTVVTRFITRRRAEIRQEIQNAYQQAIGNNH
jgi:hypothetical protein